ncbi:Neuropeptide CCHamide-1 receptor [Halotydeus destructor]|nr:Neuropeptide CCHamide-1 receptor [Halotydeus destructor]
MENFGDTMNSLYIANSHTEDNQSVMDVTVDTNWTGFEDTNATYTPYPDRPETYIVPIVFVFIFISGSIGNITLITILIKEQLIRTPSYLFILNLSLADLAVIVGTVPFVGTIYTYESWPYGDFVCKFSEFIRDVSIGVSVLTLSAMSIDRYRAAFSTVMRSGPHRAGPPLTVLSALRSPTGLTMAAIWLSSLALAGPTAYFSYVRNFDVTSTKTIRVCFPFPPRLGPYYPKLVVMVKFVLFYVVPLIIIACCYLSIALHLFSKAKAEADTCPTSASTGHSCQARPPALAASSGFKRSKKRSQSRAKLIMLLVIIFMVCFFPNHLFMIFFYYHPNAQEVYNDFWHVWRIVAFCLTFLSCCLNPITLYATSEQFNQLFNKYLHCCHFDLNLAARLRHLCRRWLTRPGSPVDSDSCGSMVQVTRWSGPGGAVDPRCQLVRYAEICEEIYEETC